MHAKASTIVCHTCITSILVFSALARWASWEQEEGYWTDLSSGLDSFPYAEVAGQPASQETDAQLPLDSPQLLNPPRHGQHTPPDGRKQTGHSNTRPWMPRTHIARTHWIMYIRARCWRLWLHIHAPLSENIKTKRVFSKQVYIIIYLLPELHHCRTVWRFRCQVATQLSIVLAGHVGSSQLHTSICSWLNHSTPFFTFYILRCQFKPTDLTSKSFSEVVSKLEQIGIYTISDKSTPTCVPVVAASGPWQHGGKGGEQVEERIGQYNQIYCWKHLDHNNGIANTWGGSRLLCYSWLRKNIMLQKRPYSFHD